MEHSFILNCSLFAEKKHISFTPCGPTIQLQFPGTSYTQWIPPKKCRSCLRSIKSSYFNYTINKPFEYSRCSICVSCSVQLTSTYNVRVRKGSWGLLRFLVTHKSTNENSAILSTCGVSIRETHEFSSTAVSQAQCVTAVLYGGQNYKF